MTVALGADTTQGSGTSTSSGTTLTVSHGRVEIGETLIVGIVCDNVTNATLPTVSSITKAGGETAAWVKIGSVDSSSATAGAGVRGELWAITVTVKWLFSTKTVTFSNAIVAKAALGVTFYGVTVTARGTVPSGTTGAAGVSTGGAPTATTAGTAIATGDLVLGLAVTEGVTVPGLDADTLNGAWLGFGTGIASGGSATTGVSVRPQYKIATAGGAQTFNPTCSTDSGVCVVGLVPQVLSAVTASRATTWNTLAAVTPTRSTTWVTKAVVTATRATTWNVLVSTSGGVVAQRGSVTAATNSLTVSKPTGVVAGDVVIVMTQIYDVTTPVVAASTGFTALGNGAVGTNGTGSYVQHTLLGKTAGGSEPSTYTATRSGSSYNDIGCIAFSGADLSNMVIGAWVSSTASGTSVVVPGVTATAPGIAVILHSSYGASASTPAGWTATGSWEGGVTQVFTKTVAAGVIPSVTLTQGNDSYTAVMFVVQPSAASGSTTPTLYYDFAGSGTTVPDMTGNGNTGQMLRAEVPADLHNSGRARFINPGDSVKYVPTTNPVTKASVTLTLRINNLSGVGGGLWQLLIGNDSSGFRASLQGAPPTWYAIIRDVGGNVAFLNYGGSAVPTMSAGVDYKLAITYDGDVLRMYHDGIQVATASELTGALNLASASSSGFRVGYNPFGDGVGGEYEVDDVRWWDDYTLTPAEVAAIATPPTGTHWTDSTFININSGGDYWMVPQYIGDNWVDAAPGVKDGYTFAQITAVRKDAATGLGQYARTTVSDTAGPWIVKVRCPAAPAPETGVLRNGYTIRREGQYIIWSNDAGDQVYFDDLPALVSGVGTVEMRVTSAHVVTLLVNDTVISTFDYSATPSTGLYTGFGAKDALVVTYAEGGDYPPTAATTRVTASRTTTWNVLSTAIALFTDDFNRSDGALGSSWASVGIAQPVISGNKIQAPAANTECAAKLTGTWSPVQSAAADVTLGEDYAETGICLHLANASTGLLCIYTTDGTHPSFPGFGTVDGPAIQLYYGNGTTFIMIANVAAPPSGTHRIYGVALATGQVQLWFDGKLALSGTDSGAVPRTATPGVTVHHALTIPATADNYRAESSSADLAAPTVSSLSPTTAAVGATVTVTGTGLVLDATQVTVGSTVVAVTVTSSTTGTFVVPSTFNGVNNVTARTPFGTATPTTLTVTGGRVVPTLGLITEVSPDAGFLSSQVIPAPTGITGGANQRVWIQAFLGTLDSSVPTVTIPGFTQYSTTITDTTYVGSGVWLHLLWFVSNTDLSAASTFTMTYSINVYLTRATCGIVNDTAGPNDRGRNFVLGTSVLMPSITVVVDELIVAWTIVDPGATLSYPVGYTPATVQGTDQTHLATSSLVAPTTGATGTQTLSATGTTTATGVEMLVWALVPALVTVTATRSTTWVVRATITSTRATSWNTTAGVSATRPTTWTTRAAITPAIRTTTWAARANVGPATRATTWNVLTPVSPSTRTTTWVVRTPVTVTRSTTWNTLVPVAAASTRTTTWVTLATVVGTRVTTWGVVQGVTTSRTTTWNVAGSLTSVTANRSTTWAVAEKVTATKTTTWAARSNVVPATRTTTWGVSERVISTRTTTWAIVTTVTPVARTTTWVTRALVTSTRPTAWNTLANVTPASRATTWNVWVQVISTRTSSWAVQGDLTFVSAPRTTAWVTRAVVTQAKATTWNTLARVTSTRASTWAVLTQVAPATRSTTWLVRAQVIASKTTTWNVDGPLAFVSASRSTTWITKATITAVRPTTWSVLTPVAAERSTTWAVLAVVISMRVTTWQVCTPVSRSRTTTWKVAGPIFRVTATRTTSWNVAPVADVLHYLALYPNTVLYHGEHRVKALYHGSVKIWPPPSKQGAIHGQQEV